MSDVIDSPARVQESQEFRRDHYRVYDENGFLSSFAVTPPTNATLTSVVAGLCERFHGAFGMGYESKDMVILLGPRIVAVVTKGVDGEPLVTRFDS